MKKQKEKYDVIKTTRITQTQDNKLEKLGISVRDAIEFAIAKYENPIEKANERRREIEFEIKEHKKQIELLKVELKEVMEEAGINAEINKNENLDAIMDAHKIIERYERTKQNKNRLTKNRSTQLNIYQFIDTGNGKRYLDYLCLEHGGEDTEKYRKEIIKHIEASMK